MAANISYYLTINKIFVLTLENLRVLIVTIKDALIGYTGFVGSNLAEQYNFEKLYNSKNITQIIDQEIDLLVCSGVSAIKWLANQQPTVDIDNIERLKQCLKQVKVNNLILISTIDIYNYPIAVDEDTVPDSNKQDFYGKHRYLLEQWVAKQENFKNCTVIRLPGLFGNHLKKNLIFDIMNPLAKSINQGMWERLKEKLDSKQQGFILKHYSMDEFQNLQQHPNLILEVKKLLIDVFDKVGFSTLNFTDSRSEFQFYNLANLWSDINTYAIEQKLKLVNLPSEPIAAAELVYYLTGKKFINHTSKGRVCYNMYSKYAPNHKYIYTKSQILEQIKYLVEGNK